MRLTKGAPRTLFYWAVAITHRDPVYEAVLIRPRIVEEGECIELTRTFSHRGIALSLQDGLDYGIHEPVELCVLWWSPG